MSERPGSIRQNGVSRWLDHPPGLLEKHPLVSYGVRLGRLESEAGRDLLIDHYIRSTGDDVAI